MSERLPPEVFGLYDTDQGFRLKVAGDDWYRIHITPQGEIRTGNGTAPPAATSASGHIAAATDAHDASAISVAPTGGITETDAQAAMAGLDTRKARKRVYNVLDYASINAAVSAASSAGGGTVKVPYRSSGYDISTLLTIPTRVVVECEGEVDIRATGSSRSVMIRTAAGSVGAGFRGGTIRTGGLITSSIFEVQGTRPVVEGNVFSDPTYTAVQGIDILTGTIGANVEENTLDQIMTAIRGLYASTDTRIYNNEIKNWRQRGIYILGDATRSSDNIYIARNRVRDLVSGGTVRYPIFFSGNSANPHTRPVVWCNIVKGPAKSWTAADPGTADQISLSSVRDFKIIGNESYDGGDMGITAAIDAIRGIIANNTTRGNDASGIDVGYGAGTDTSEITVTGNVCTNNGQNRNADRPAEGRSGIRVYNSQEIVLSGNILGDDQATKTQQYGACFTGCDKGTAGPDIDSGNALSLYALNGAGNTNMQKVTLGVM